MTICNAEIHVIDDDEAVCAALDSLFRSIGYRVSIYPSADDFLAAAIEDAPGCIVTDVRLPGTSGLDLQTYLTQLEIRLPVILMTGFGDIPMVVQAMKAGAIDFLTKPFRDQDMLDAITLAIETDTSRRQEIQQIATLRERRASLTPRETQVMDLVLAGKLNKQVAGELDISEVTVKVHRSAAMKKMGARSIAQWARMAEILERSRAD